jgi:hypothetical protein
MTGDICVIRVTREADFFAAMRGNLPLFVRWKECPGCFFVLSGKSDINAYIIINTK